jgi:ABC-type phosphate/phosphonate transport system substrate-binding protein
VSADALLLGAVAYDPKVVAIWTGFRHWLRAHELPFDFVLYSNYERQVDDLIAGRVHVAWNSGPTDTSVGGFARSSAGRLWRSSRSGGL